MTLRRSLFALLAVSTLVLTAAVPRAQTAAQAPAPVKMAGFPGSGEPAIVTVISAGAAPRKLLRYQIPAGYTGNLTLMSEISTTNNIMGQTMPMTMPTTTTSATLAATNIAENGDITYTVSLTDLKLEGGDGLFAQAMGGMTDQLKGAITSIKNTATMTNRGVMKSSKMDVPDPAMKELLSQMSGSLDNLGTALPEEAVGVGAKWEVRVAVTTSGAVNFLKTTYEVTSLDGQTVGLKVTSEQTAPAQPVSNAMLSGMGAEVTMDKLTGAGTGTLVIKLDSLVPTSTMESTTSSSMTVNMAGQSLPMTSDGKIKLTVTPVK
ncbi:MAG TPA: hypothetical protein VFV78_02665 [Vicinamibacterales bacterium]|nr:hypothetical protein [Vicinamibacterales bacterium]